MLPTIARDLGHTHLVELFENARRARKEATCAAQDLKAAAGSSAQDRGAAALDEAGADPGEANRAAGEREDQKKRCWLCHSPELADQLRKCSGCHKVRLLTAKSILVKPAQMCIVRCLSDSAALNSDEILKGTLL